MGKQPQHNSKNSKSKASRARVTTQGSATFVVKGQTFSTAYGTTDAIGEFLRGKGYPVGTLVRWNGWEYLLVENETAGYGHTLRVVGT